MNILFYMTRYPGWGGIENVTSLIVSELSKTENVFILSHLQQNRPDLSLSDITLYEMPDKDKWVTPANCRFAEKIVVDHSIDAIIYQDSYASTEKIVCELASKLSIKLFVFEHNSPLYIYNKRDLDPITTIKGFLRRVLHKYLLNKEIERKKYLLSHCKKYVLLSEKFVPEFCQLIGVNNSDNRIIYISNPIQVSINHKVKKENLILCVSRLAKEKRVDVMLDMWKLACEQLSNWRFVIVGDGMERDKLQSKVEKESIPRVEFMGFTNPIPYYQRSKIFWMTSKFEGWGLTLVEAMQQGCVPVVWHSFSSLTDIIDNGISGGVVPNNDTSSFLSFVMTLANNTELLDQMSNSAFEKAKSFEIENIMEKWKKLLGISFES